MKILHIAWGLMNSRSIVQYVKALLEAEAKNGWETFYFFPGRQSYNVTGPELKKYKTELGTMYEIINAPKLEKELLRATNPETDLSEPVTDAFFTKVMKEVKPDIVHIHELQWLSSTIIEIAKKEFHVPLVMTLHNYHLLCPTFNLFDFQFQNCLQEIVGRKCVLCTRNALSDSPINEIRNKLLFLPNGIYRSIRKPGIWFLNYSKKKSFDKYLAKSQMYHIFIPLLKKGLSLVFTQLRKKRKDGSNESIKEPLKELFQKRREINVERLKMIDLLIAHSKRVEEIYRFFMKTDNLITLNPIHNHLDNIFYKQFDIVNFPIKFGTIAGCANIEKGVKVIIEALKILKEKGLSSKFLLIVLGDISPNFQQELSSLPNVIIIGRFRSEDYNRILDHIDVGIIPSIWEEIFGVVGSEFLAKGIPIIGNKRGGIVDYTIENMTGWINKTCSGQELAEIMQNIINNPQEIVKLNNSIIQHRNQFVYPYNEFYKKNESFYHQILEKNYAKNPNHERHVLSGIKPSIRSGNKDCN